MTYNNLKPDDTMVVNRGENSYKVTVDSIKTDSPTLQDTDVFLVNRGENSTR